MNVTNDKVTLSIIIPCYNERNSIEAVIARVLASPILHKEIIVIDDCSTDGTREILETKIKSQVAKVIYHEKNAGKGAALRTGIRYATGDIVIIQDADMEYDPDEYPRVIEKIVNGETDVCYGSRFLNTKAKGYKANQIANKFLTFLSNCFTHAKLTDMETCYKAFKREVISHIEIEEERFGFEPEITAKLVNAGYKIMEVPISYYPRTNEEGKKIGVRDGIQAIKCIIKYRNA